MDSEHVWRFLKTMVTMLGEMLGDSFEIVLHDTRNPASSIVAIVHGEITGRKVGDPCTNLGLPVIDNPYGEHDVYNYRTQTRTGKVLKSSSAYFKDDTGKVFAALCVNWDVSDLIRTSNVLRDMASTTTTVEETFTDDINEVITKILDDTIAWLNKPAAQLDKEEKLRVIQLLNDKGVFTVKHSVDRVAALLGVSRVTIYSYLNEVQAMEKGRIV